MELNGRLITGTAMTEAYDGRGRGLLDAEREQLGKVRKNTSRPTAIPNSDQRERTGASIPARERTECVAVTAAGWEHPCREETGGR